MRCVALMIVREEVGPGPIASKPVFAWNLDEARRSNSFDAIYLATDSTEVGEVVSGHYATEVELIELTSANDRGRVGSQRDLLDIRTRATFDVVCVIDPCSTSIHSQDLSDAMARFQRESLDSLISVTPSAGPQWSAEGVALDFDLAARNRGESLQPSLTENGAFYFVSATVLDRYQCMVGGRIGLHVVSNTDRSASAAHMQWALPNLSDIEVLVLDVDGTLTDGGMYYGPDGELAKRFCTQDGMGLERVRNAGVRVCVITGEDSPAVHARMRKLGIEEYFPGVKNKIELLRGLIAEWGVTLSDVAFVGDDFGDLECLGVVGFASCPADSAPEIETAVHYVCKRGGGAGAVREVCDLICNQRESPALLAQD